MPDVGVFGLEFENKIVIFEISALKLIRFAIFRPRIKIPKLGTKNALFGYFWVEFIFKIIVTFEKSTPEFVKNGFLRYTAHSGIEFAFYKSPGSGFTAIL